MATLKLASSQFAALQLAATRRELSNARAQILEMQAKDHRREAASHDATAAALLRGAGADPSIHTVVAEGPEAGTVIVAATGEPFEIADAPAPEVTVESAAPAQS